MLLDSTLPDGIHLAEQGPVLHSLQSLLMDPNASPDGGNEPEYPPWGGDGEGGFDGYDAGDEASSPAQHVRVQELSVGGEEGEDDVEAM